MEYGNNKTKDKNNKTKDKKKGKISNEREVDAVIGEAEIGIEIKSTEEIQSKHLSNFKEFSEEFPNSRCIVVSRDPITRRAGEVEVMYIFDFLQKLWAGELF